MKHILPLFLRALGKLPLSFMRHVGSLFGRFSYLGRTRMAQVTRRNIERCYPQLSQQEQRALEKQSLRETGRMAGETLVVWSRPYAWVRSRIRAIQGLDHVKGLLEEEKGLVILGPHLGNWEVLGLYVTELGTVTSLYDPPKRAEVEELVRRARQTSGANMVPTNRKGVVALFQALQNGHISGILPDQSPHIAGGRFSEFFDQPTFTMTLIHKLIQKTDCRAVFAVAKRVDNGWEVVFKPAPVDIYSPDEALSLRALNQGVEDCVAEAPAQYQWEYKRFKRQPEGATEFYGKMN